MLVLLALVGCGSVPLESSIRPPDGSSPLFVVAGINQRSGMLLPPHQQGVVVDLPAGRYDLLYVSDHGYFYAMGGRSSTAGIYLSADGREAWAWLTDHNSKRQISGRRPPPRGAYLALRLGQSFFAKATWSEEEFHLRFVPAPSPAKMHPGLSRRRPNQALQPTRMLVTFCAFAQPAPSTRVADL